jgi:hypothetical protein
MDDTEIDKPEAYILSEEPRSKPSIAEAIHPRRNTKLFSCFIFPSNYGAS